MSEKRLDPWIGYVYPSTARMGAPSSGYPKEIYGRASGCLVPVVVTPLLPDDPKVGEVWQRENGTRYEILSAPWTNYEGRAVVRGNLVESHGRGFRGSATSYVDKLHRIPETKTFRLEGMEIQADSIEDAVEKIKLSIKEVK